LAQTLDQTWDQHIFARDSGPNLGPNSGPDSGPADKPGQTVQASLARSDGVCAAELHGTARSARGDGPRAQPRGTLVLSVAQLRPRGRLRTRRSLYTLTPGGTGVLPAQGTASRRQTSGRPGGIGHRRSTGASSAVGTAATGHDRPKFPDSRSVQGLVPGLVPGLRRRVRPMTTPTDSNSNHPASFWSNRARLNLSIT
jgi:hypothetical protein